MQIKKFIALQIYTVVFICIVYIITLSLILSGIKKVVLLYVRNATNTQLANFREKANNNNNNFIVPIKGPRRGRELHIKQILIQCTYNNTTFFMPDRIRDKVMIYTIHINTTYDNNNPSKNI
jgi:hypothetical protein